jgi:hypothetical protein
MGGSARAEVRKLLGDNKTYDLSIKTGRRAGVAGPSTSRSYPPPPPSWLGTLPEWAIFWAHAAIGLELDQDFAYLYKMEEAPNGVDFFEFDLQMAIEIQGLYWHYGLGAAKQLSDLERKIRIESLGITVIFIDEDHALQDPVYFLREARNGIDHSRAGKGLV